MGKEITCKNCGWQWNTSDSEEYDKYVCHKCGFDNRTFYDSEPIGETYSKGGRTISQTPAPKKDRIFGSKVNPKGSASSEKSASKIVLSEKIIGSLKKKLAENNNKKVSLNDLKAVYRRGLGAYSTSYRPTISGGKPNSRNAWAMARVNKFLEKAAGKKVKAAYVQDDDLLNYHLGGDMTMHLAPNGKPSNLTHEQWHLVRTPEFKAWFGDWENDPQNASKVVDDNGEPLVVYHATKNDFYKFEEGKNTVGTFGRGIYFANSKGYASDYNRGADQKILSVFLNITNPIRIKNKLMPDGYEKFSVDKMNENKGFSRDFTAKVKSENYNGVVAELLYNDVEFVAFYPNQIKLADGSNTTFDSANADIRYENGGLIKNEQFYNWYLDWYKNDVEGMTIMFTLPSEFTRLSNTSENDIILDVFQKNENVDAKKYLQQIVDNADKYGVTIYLHPIPRTHRLMSEEHKSKITTDYIISYFEKFDFVIDADRFFMVRKPKVNYEQGGKVEDMTIQELNIEYIRLNKKYLKEQKIQRKFADEKNWVGHDKQIEVLNSINDRMMEVSTILEIKEDEAKKNKSKRYDGGGLIYKKHYKRGGGGYTTIINGLEVTILKQYSYKTWIAQSMMGEIDIEKESLKEIKYYLENLDENFKIRYDGGGEVTDCKEYIMQNKSFFANGYFFDMQKLSEINDPYGQVPKDLDFTLIGIDIINSSLLADKLSQLFNFSKTQSYIVIQYFIDNAERLNDIKQIKTEKMVIVDRDNIVCENLSYANGGEITNACIEEVINIINSIQNVKDYYIHDGKLVIVFVEDLMVYGIDMINYHIGQFQECHDVIEPEAIVNDKEDYKSIYFILKKDDATIGKYHLGGDMSKHLAPNGKPSNLTHEQWHLVRTPEFKEWFGDWENDPQNASKVVDKNGEPLIVYRGDIGKFNIFNSKNNQYGKIWFTDNYEVAKTYTLSPFAAQDDVIFYVGGVRKFFLNIRGLYINTSIKKSEHTKNVGIIITNQYDAAYDLSKGEVNLIGNNYIVFESNQIKLADGTNTTFDSSNSDIRYKEGGNIDLFGQIAGLMAKGTEYIEGYDENKRYILSADKEIRFENQNNIDRIQGKPKGLWYSIGNSWAEYIYNEIPDKIDFYNYLYEIKVTNKIKIIDTIEEAIEFTKKYGDSYGYATESIDWGEVAQDYSGIEIKDPYNFSRIEYSQLFWMYGWDIPSGCVWDRSGIESIEFIEKSQSLYKEGGEVENKETYAKWKSLVNMSSSELERFYNSEEGKKAGLTPQQAKNEGIDSGRESARMILKMKDTKVSDWTPNMWRWAKKQISFISRMSGVKGSLYDDKGNKTRKHLALLIWGNNPEKKNNGGEINNHKNTNNMESFKFNGLPHIDTISDNDLILIKEEVFVGDIDKPMHKGTRYVSCKVMSKGGMVDSLNLKVIKSVGANALSVGQTITRPIANLVSNGRKMINSYKDGGEMPKEIESYFKEFAEINKKSNETTAIVNKISDKDERPMGLTSDRIKATQEYKEAKMESDKAFQRLREFNSSEKGKAIQKYLRGFDRMEQMEIRKKYFSKGGELNPDNKVVKQYFAHDSGNAGGVLVGKRHSEGGIKATNNSTGQPIEMEGGEVVITRGAVSNPKKYSFEGKEMTTREVLSKLNVDGGGISFADGGDVPEKMNCGCSTMKLGGETMSTQDFITMSENEYQDIRLREGIQKEKKDHYSTLSKLNSGAITIEDAFREIAQKEMSLDSKYPFAE